MRKEEPNTSQTSCRHSTDACAAEPTHATHTPLGSLPIGTLVRVLITRVPAWKLKGYAVGAWGNLCKAGLPSGRQNAAHDQITERKLSIPRFRNHPVYRAHQGTARTRLGCRCWAHLCRSNASPIALGGSLGITSSRCTNGCDHAHSEHFHFADSLVGNRILRVVSSMSTTLRPFSATSDDPMPS